MDSKKIGRPTTAPKRTQIMVRFDDATLKKLDAHCKKYSLTRAEGVRVAVQRLPDENKER